METREQLIKWIQQGKQKRAVARTLYKPMTSSEIMDSCLEFAPAIELRDIWKILKHFLNRNLVEFLTEEKIPTGQIWTLTPLGQSVIKDAFDIHFQKPNPNINWPLYSYVVRAKTRRTVLIEIGTNHYENTLPKTATNIRKNLRQTYPLGLNPTIRALEELTSADLITNDEIEYGKNRLLKAYSLTDQGEQIREQLLR